MASLPTSRRTQQEFIIETNNSSIVSKRSVERLYFSSQPQFYRHFVKKPKRRSPLINRGYWLRIKAIDSVVSKFLAQNCTKRKFVINLGCGYDTLPWVCLSRYQTKCDGVCFVDIDHRDLIIRKRKIIQETPDLNSMLNNIEVTEGHILLRSDQYLLVGCDLRCLYQLSEILSDIVNAQDALILFIAEVSITYMDVKNADNLIEWASKFPYAKFCLLEQILPEGIEHPFGRTMIAHFEKLNSPLGAVQKYPTTISQIRRFRDLGWPDVSAKNLWELWSSNDFLTAEERIALNAVEAFDEWEEFCLYGNHYFILVASTLDSGRGMTTTLSTIPIAEINPCSNSRWKAKFTACQKPQGRRRFAAPLLIKSHDKAKDKIALFSGAGMMSRLNSRDEYSTSDQDLVDDRAHGFATPRSRMCHTITELGDAGALLVGGRTSPDSGLRDCWLYHKYLDIWERVDDLPWPLYRHQALSVGANSVLISIGRINSTTLSDHFLLWSRRTSWRKCNYADFSPSPVYSPVIFCIPETKQNIVHGILAGGINTEGVLLNKVWRWKITGMFTENPIIEFQEFSMNLNLCRFGASVVTHLGKVYLIGGIVKDQLVATKDEIISLDVSGEEFRSTQVLSSSALSTRYLFIGSNVVSIGKELVVMGGSAVCFSFGTFWNDGCLTLLPKSSIMSNEWKFLRTVEARTSILDTEPINLKKPYIRTIPRIRLLSESHFSEVLDAGKPMIFEGLTIGPCISKWNMEHLKQTIGEDKEVVVHEASTKYMDFTTKNFKYSRMKFGEFVRQIEDGAKLYLRSLSSEDPSSIPADISRDFPSFCSDFSLPPELSFVTKNFHSSPLRISGPVIMWLHYDTPANVLCQIKGNKKILLFQPSDFKYFDFQPGKSSSPVNVFQGFGDSKQTRSQPYEASLKPGDILYIPPLWLHTASPESGTSVAVNVFFNLFSNGHAAGKDVYGNRDLLAYEKGRQSIAKIVASFDSVPPEARDFYLQRLIAEFKENSKCAL
ncbi:tRNA wybutosine-synthesizing protein 4 [Golovinomyces cichoracearum]|uniref:tRNA wybutosine-synthesizing protein 4 n=1 Tax=Golovinomyces cichoracearum TaxID=62708 RepID=A0A420HR79_9PEZI|nr:tRNA wybutosine-synthesizing protein 4 [Golovinomyces cichoracearum]